MNKLNSKSPLSWYRVAFKIGHGLPEGTPHLEFIKAEIQARSPEIAACGLIAKIFPDYDLDSLDLFQTQLQENGSYMTPFGKSVNGVWIRPIIGDPS